MEQRNSRKIVGHVHKTEKVQALTGEVHSVPLRAVAKYDDAEVGVKAGDVIYILHYSGEGYWAAWHNGRVVGLQDFSEKGPHPKSTWWVKLKTKAGGVGWTTSHRNFSNQDACG